MRPSLYEALLTGGEQCLSVPDPLIGPGTVPLHVDTAESPVGSSPSVEAVVGGARHHPLNEEEAQHVRFRGSRC